MHPTDSPTSSPITSVEVVEEAEPKPIENKEYIDEHQPTPSNAMNSKTLALIIGVPLFWLLVCIAVPLYYRFHSKREESRRFGEGVVLHEQPSIDLQRISSPNICYDEPDPVAPGNDRRSSEGNRTKRSEVDMRSEAGSNYPHSVVMMGSEAEAEEKQTEMDGNVSETEEQSNYDALYEGGEAKKKVTASGSGDSGKQLLHVTPGARAVDEEVGREMNAEYTIPMATILTPKTALSALTVDLPASAMSDKESLLGCSIGSPEDNFHLLYGPGNKVTPGEDSD